MANFKYVMVDSHPLPSEYFYVEEEMFEKAGIECIFAECKTVEEVLACAKDADAIGTVGVPMMADFLKQLEKCKVIVRFGVGYDSVDIKAAAECGIMVANMPTYCMDEVATHVMALFLDIVRKTTMHDKNFRKGIWNGGLGYESRRLSALTFGIVGFGNIARKTAQYAKGFDMKVVAYDPYVPDSVFAEDGVARVTLDELYAVADVVTLNIPLNDGTKHLINKESIAKMKDGVFIVNCARGPVIKTEDLIDALNSGKVTAAGLDVFEGEPITDPDYPLCKMDNVVLTPHSAYNSREAIIAQHECAADTVIRVLCDGETPYNIVNKDMLKK